MQPKTAAKFWKESFFVFSFFSDWPKAYSEISTCDVIKQQILQPRFYTQWEKCQVPKVSYKKHTGEYKLCAHDVSYSSWTFALIIVFYANVCNILVG